MQGFPAAGAVALLAAALVLPPGAGAGPVGTPSLWHFHGAATSSNSPEGGTGCPASNGIQQQGTLDVVLDRNAGAGPHRMAFAFHAAGLLPCVVRGCAGSGDAAAGWSGVCPEPLVFNAWELRPRGDGTYRFRFQAELWLLLTHVQAPALTAGPR